MDKIMQAKQALIAASIIEPHVIQSPEERAARVGEAVDCLAAAWREEAQALVRVGMAMARAEDTPTSAPVELPVKAAPPAVSPHSTPRKKVVKAAKGRR